jgi:hypothetical protein
MSNFGEEYTHVPQQCDSTSAMSVAKNPVLHVKTKQIPFFETTQRKGR